MVRNVNKDMITTNDHDKEWSCLSLFFKSYVALWGQSRLSTSTGRNHVKKIVMILAPFLFQRYDSNRSASMQTIASLPGKKAHWYCQLAILWHRSAGGIVEPDWLLLQYVEQHVTAEVFFILKHRSSEVNDPGSTARNTQRIHHGCANVKTLWHPKIFGQSGLLPLPRELEFSQNIVPAPFSHQQNLPQAFINETGSGSCNFASRSCSVVSFSHKDIFC